jgi:2-oxo-3-hexenedioate decarboxylase
MSSDPTALAPEIAAAYAERRSISAPSSRDGTFDVATAYAVERELVRMRRAAGRATVGRKVGFANRAMWRVLKLDTLVWAHMYDDTVHYAQSGGASFSLAGTTSAKIEPEVVVKLKGPVDSTDAAVVLESVEWLAVGFEIIDCSFPDWKFQPADFVVEALPRIKVRLLRDGELVEEGLGKNALKSPAACVGELAAAMSQRTGAETLQAGELISTGTLTASQPIAPGETWVATVDGLDLQPLTLRLI